MSSAQSQKVSISFSDLSMRQAILELRTLPTYLHWDHAGSLWTEMLRRYPTLVLAQAEPTKTIFALERKYIFSVQMEGIGADTHTNITLTAHKPPPTLKEFGGMAKIFVQIAQEYLGISEYIRAGLRLIFFKDFPSLEEASGALLSTGL